VTLAKVFDCENHGPFLFKLKYYGIHGEICIWFQSYLYNKKQNVEIKSSKTEIFCSSWEIVKHGVHWGSVLGPILLTIRINDFPLQINSFAEVIMFADDSSNIVSHTNYSDFITVFNLVLLHISKWFQTKQLTSNVEKTSIIRFTPTKFSLYTLNLVYADQAVTKLDTLKFLGLHLEASHRYSTSLNGQCLLCYKKIIPCIRY
jgi:hypothetical protein